MLRRSLTLRGEDPALLGRLGNEVVAKKSIFFEIKE